MTAKQIPNSLYAPDGSMYVCSTNGGGTLAGSSGTQDSNITQVAGATIAQGHGTAATAIRVELPTDGTGVVGAAQSGTWTVQPGNTANTTAWLTTPKKSGTGTKSNVASSASSVTILASNASRLGASIYNDSTQILYLDLSGGTASSSSYSLQLAANAWYILDFNYTGLITGIWASANGNARVTEFT